MKNECVFLTVATSTITQYDVVYTSQKTLQCTGAIIRANIARRVVIRLDNILF